MARFATLTPQQMRVLMMLSKRGLLNKQIAYELSVSGSNREGACLRHPAEARGRESHAGGDPPHQDRDGQLPRASSPEHLSPIPRQLYTRHAPASQQRTRRDAGLTWFVKQMNARVTRFVAYFEAAVVP